MAWKRKKSQTSTSKIASAATTKNKRPDKKLYRAFYFCMVIVRFCWGFWQKWVVERGFLMVNLWWIRGESWFVDGHFSGAKNIPQL
jgi:hypothetical protein